MDVVGDAKVRPAAMGRALFTVAGEVNEEGVVSELVSEVLAVDFKLFRLLGRVDFVLDRKTESGLFEQESDLPVRRTECTDGTPPSARSTDPRALKD